MLSQPTPSPSHFRYPIEMLNLLRILTQAKAIELHQQLVSIANPVQTSRLLVAEGLILHDLANPVG